MMRHMKRNPIPPIVVIALAGLLTASSVGVFTASPSMQGTTTAQASAGAAQLGTIKEYCAGCHNDRAKTGGVSFEGLTAANIGERAEVFEKAVRKLNGRVMPPPGARQPDAKAVDSLVAWLEGSLDRAETRAHVPDQLVLHRLNRREYANAVRDLLTVEIDAEKILPADDTVEG